MEGQPSPACFRFLRQTGQLCLQSEEEKKKKAQVLCMSLVFGHHHNKGKTFIYRPAACQVSIEGPEELNIPASLKCRFCSA